MHIDARRWSLLLCNRGPGVFIGCSSSELPCMHFSLANCIILAALFTGSCSALPELRAWHLPWWHGRSLLQRASSNPQQQLPPAGNGNGKSERGIPACMWNDVKESCSPSQLVHLSLNAAPSTLLHRAATAAYDRNLVCNGHPDAESCTKDRSNRCFYWNKSCVGMDAYELVNWFGAGSNINGDAALLDFTCPGTVAAQFKLCRTATDAGAKGICNSLPGCQFVPLMKECVPKTFDSKSLGELQNLTKAYSSFDSSIWGSCEGACYVRQASACQQSYNSSTGCQAKPYCTWEFDPFDGRTVCVHKDTAGRGTDAFSQEYAAIKDNCAKRKGQMACEELQVRPKNVGKFRAARPVDSAIVTEASVKCVI